jgi:hypothetical protein
VVSVLFAVGRTWAGEVSDTGVRGSVSSAGNGSVCGDVCGDAARVVAAMSLESHVYAITIYAEKCLFAAVSHLSLFLHVKGRVLQCDDIHMLIVMGADSACARVGSASFGRLEVKESAHTHQILTSIKVQLVALHVLSRSQGPNVS